MSHKELLRLSPVYCVVGAYRVFHDPKLRGPIVSHLGGAARKGAVIGAVWALIAFPLTKVYVRFFMNRSNLFGVYGENASLFHVPIQTYAAIILTLSQASAIMEFFMATELKKARKEAYAATVRSRGKDDSFWGPYVEEWAVPPISRAESGIKKQGFYKTLASPLVRMIITKVFLIPLNFVPFLGMIIGAALKSLSMGMVLHEPYFKAKKLTPFQQSLWLAERQMEYRAFGFVGALLERVPIAGLLFSVSNRVGAAMLAFSMEKQQHRFASGELKPTRVYVSKTANLPDPDLPEHLAGSFPRKKVGDSSEGSIEVAGTEGGVVS